MSRQLLEYLVREFPAIPRKELYARILCGEVLVDGGVARDPRQIVPEAGRCEFRTRAYVSRGGVKLERALVDHGIDPVGKVVLDAGASAGGFTDCLLSRGAALVHAVDVGYNQLDFSLRRRPEVVVRERTNIMHVSSLDPQPHFAVADLSFRSLRGAAKHVLTLVRDDALLALVKPQFEWIHPDATFDGVVRREGDLESILLDLASDLAAEGVSVVSVSESPIAGREGNREFFFRLSNSGAIRSGDAEGMIRSLFA